METKICTKCKTNHPIKEYRKDKSKIDGLYSSCNDCYRKKYGMQKRPESHGKWHIENSTGYIRKGNSRQHRVLMEEKLGRKLERHEHVHHINHDKTDNRLENLVVLHNTIHRMVHPGREKQGKIYECILCGKEKYYWKSQENRISKQYRCKECYTTKYVPRPCHIKIT